MKKVLCAVVAAATVLLPISASEAQVQGSTYPSGNFDVIWVNCTDSNAERSQATIENYREASSRAAQQEQELLNASDNRIEPSCERGGVSYTGPLKFSTADPNSNTTIEQWLRSSGGEIVESLRGDMRRRLSKAPDASGPNTGITTIFEIQPNFPVLPSDFLIVHDAGVELLQQRSEDDVSFVRLGGSPALTAPKITIIRGHDGNRPLLIYAAANGDPSVLVVFADTRPAP